MQIGINSIIFICAYLIGSIPIGYLFAKSRGIKDIREHGSGSIGATNVARNLGTRYFFLIFFCDALKSFFSIALIACLSSEFVTLFGASLFLLLGNVFPIFLGFKGGKGVATSAGIMAFFNGPIFLCAACGWALLLAYFRRVGFASVLVNVGVASVSFIWLLYGGPRYLFIFMVAALLSLLLHKRHISDLYIHYFGGRVV